MRTISTKDELNVAVAKVQRYGALVTKYQGYMNKYRAMMVHYLETKNMRGYDAEDGSRWQKRQSTSVTYQLDALRKLLRRKHVDPVTIIKSRTVEEVDEEQLLHLLSASVITLEEYEAISIRHT